MGYSVQGQSILAYRVGKGPIKVVLVGDVHGGVESNTYRLAQQLSEYYLSSPAKVPEQVSLWIIPTLNPDGLASGNRWNAHGVDLNRNADTTLDGCAGNDWSPDTFDSEGKHPSAGGAYPFSEPETRALRDFVADARVVVFYHSAGEAIYADACQRSQGSKALAAALAAGTGYAVPSEGWVGYPTTGDLADYLAGEGVASATVELKNHQDAEFERNLAGVRSLLEKVDSVLAAEAAQAGAEMVWLDDSNMGVWRYPQNSFVHPLALEVVGKTAYMVDGGRVLALDLSEPTLPRTLLAPGDAVAGVRVLEPLDLALDRAAVLVLDRAGDIYRYDPATTQWKMDRYGRPSGQTSDHYYVAVATTGGSTARDRYLLDATHEQVWRYDPGQNGSAWAKVTQGRQVDVSASSQGVYVLTRALNGPKGNLALFKRAGSVSAPPVSGTPAAPAGKQTVAFRLGIGLLQPRQVVAADDAIYVLDRAGRRVLALQPKDGAVESDLEFADRRAVSAIAAGTGAGATLVLAGRDALYFYGQPERQATVVGENPPSELLPYDPSLLESLRGLQVPITGATITRRDFQLPGAPRHYRLGVHEGSDFYGSTTGVTIDQHTPVRAIADGVVVRAALDYQPLTAPRAADLAARCRSLRYTPPEVLDAYRGRQVWIQHDNGLVSRYAHLSAIAPGIIVGARVSRGQVIAMVGNSGTPDSVKSSTVDVHLHLELWLGDHYIGQFLRPVEAREWIERILR